MRPILKSVLMSALALMLGLPMASGAANLRELARCEPDVDASVVSREGLFTVHVVCDRLLLEIPDSLYDRDMLLSTEFAAISGGSDFIAPGTLVSNRIVRLNRRGTKVNIEGMNYDIVSEREPGIERAVEATTLPTLLGTFDILGRGAKGEAIVDLTPMFVTEPPKGFALGFMKYFGTKEIDAKSSYIESVKTFPRNVGIRYYQTWVADNADLMKRIQEGEESVVASMGFVFYTNIYLLPDKPMRPRFWDSRVGFFSTLFQDYGSGEYGGIARGFIQRYRLEKRDPEVPLSDPLQPILFYIGRDVPEIWRPYVKQGVEDWQEVFARAGFSNAILARNAPDEDEDPTWDPEDISHNVMRWAPSGRRNALGAAVVDPRSGEVISSHTVFWHDVLKLLETWYFTQASPLDPRAQKLPLQRDLMGELLRYVVRHEIGHALGLRHNFKATSDIGAKELRDPVWTGKWGTSASIMSYARFNYVAQPGDGAGLMPKFGPYDYFAIDWGYRMLPADITPDEEHVQLDEIAALQVANPRLRFGGEDEIARLDPGVFSNVLGGDAIEAADLGLRNIDRIMSFIIPATTQTGESYDRLREMYEAVIQQRHQELAYVTKLIGGVEETRYQAGRGKAPFAAVAPGRQRQAVKFIVQRALIEPKALLDREILNRIAQGGGANPLQGSNVDLMRRMIDPDVFQRMLEASNLGQGRYTGLEMLSDLTDGLFKELAAKSPDIGPYRRQVQRSYVTVLLTATETIQDPAARSAHMASASIEGRYGDSGERTDPEALLRRSRTFDSAIAKIGAQYSVTGPLSEFRAILRAAVAELYKKINQAIVRTRDADTLLHLRALRAQLAEVP